MAFWRKERLEDYVYPQKTRSSQKRLGVASLPTDRTEVYFINIPLTNNKDVALDQITILKYSYLIIIFIIIIRPIIVYNLLVKKLKMFASFGAIKNNIIIL